MITRRFASQSLGPAVFLLLLCLCLAAHADDFAALCTDRTAIERVYYNHRTGTKPPFEQTLPRPTLEQLVRTDLRKETVLREHYGVVVTTNTVAAEVQRINITTRAPEMLAELKAALGYDADRFARSVVRPIVVDRLLRQKFENDDALHADTRRECERARLELLTAKTNRASASSMLALLSREQGHHVSEVTWQLTVRPAETNATSFDELEIKQRFGPDAQLLSPPQAERDERVYFDDVPSELRRVLRVQLQQAGDVSAVIETPGGFLLYLATAKSDQALTVASLSLPKRSYEEWLSQQDGGLK